MAKLSKSNFTILLKNTITFKTSKNNFSLKYYKVFSNNIQYSKAKGKPIEIEIRN